MMQKWMDLTINKNYVNGQITNDGTLVLIETELKELEYIQWPAPKRNWTIRIIKEDRDEAIELKNVPLLPSMVDFFSDGTILIVQSRCKGDGENLGRNARRYNPNGQLISAFTLGDGINDVQIDETDTIWVSYFDEGVFGDYTYGEPMGSDGLVAYSIEGQKLWGAGHFEIAECYALNVVHSKEVYFYYYDDFHLVQLNNQQEVARFLVEGDDTFQQFILDQQSLIVQVDSYTMMRYKIRNRTITPADNLYLIDEDGKRISGQVFMRGKYLYAFGKNGLYKKTFS
ncbi:hypothetical protein M3612_20940 [Niallia taxi]|uniref:hypothetical protein n=1 Tax=Niallia taxi TaxID=2499688 RepID=UPI00203B2EAF|nr:hypothetical protein [Niallia taxi]MCM3216958.1 hypothetical protein [Niallia taxi]